MKLKKFFSVLTIFVCVFAIAGIAFAENRIEVEVTSEPVPLKATCDKAGGFSFEFDEGTVLTAGDQITMDLDFGVTLCRPINLIISPIPDTTYNNTTKRFTSGTGWGAAGIIPAVIPTIGTAAASGVAVTQTNVIPAGNGVFFHVYGNAGSQRITVDVIGLAAGDKLTVGNATGDKLVLKFLDGVAHTTSIRQLAATVPATPNLLFNTNAATIAQNTLCVNVSQFSGDKVFASLDSRNDKFTFVPSNPQVAHIVGASAVTLASCKGAQLGAIMIPQEQGACTPFDYDTDNSAGYNSPHSGNRIILSKSGASFSELDNYQITLQILSPANVYWSNQPVQVYGLAQGVCGTTPSTGGIWTRFTDLAGNVTTTSSNILGSRAAYTYRNVANNALVPANILGRNSSCTIPDNAKAKTLVTNAAPIFNSDVSAVTTVGANGTTTVGGSLGLKTDTGLWIDIPTLIYETGVKEGEEVKIRLTLSKTPCGTVYSGVISLGAFGKAPESDMLVYPYFTSLSDENWWNGISISNVGSVEEGKAKLFLFEADGDEASMEVTVKAHQTYIGLLSNLVDSFKLTKTVDGTIGNSPAYLWVCTDFWADGFAMIANDTDSVNGGESMGYLPRNFGFTSYRNFCQLNY